MEGRRQREAKRRNEMGEERGWKEKEGDIDRREREIEGRKFKEEGRR